MANSSSLILEGSEDLMKLIKGAFKGLDEVTEAALRKSSDNLLEAVNKGKTDEWVEAVSKGGDEALKTLVKATGFKTYLSVTSRSQKFALDFVTAAKTEKTVDFAALSAKHGLSEEAPIVRQAKVRFEEFSKTEKSSVVAENTTVSTLEKRVKELEKSDHTRGSVFGNDNIYVWFKKLARESDSTVGTITFHTMAETKRFLLNRYGAVGLACALYFATDPNGKIFQGIGAGTKAAGQGVYNEIKEHAPELATAIEENADEFAKAMFRVVEIPLVSTENFLMGFGVTEKSAHMISKVVHAHPAILATEVLIGKEIDEDLIVKQIEIAQSHKGGIDGYIADQWNIPESKVSEFHEKFKTMKETGEITDDNAKEKLSALAKELQENGYASTLHNQAEKAIGVAGNKLGPAVSDVTHKFGAAATEAKDAVQGATHKAATGFLGFNLMKNFYDELIEWCKKMLNEIGDTLMNAFNSASSPSDDLAQDRRRTPEELDGDPDFVAQKSTGVRTNLNLNNGFGLSDLVPEPS